MKKTYEPLSMIMNGRYAVLFGKLPEKEKEDTLARMATLIGDVGIPCYVREDGSVTLYSKDVGLEPRPESLGAACSIDGRGC